MDVLHSWAQWILHVDLCSFLRTMDVTPGYRLTPAHWLSRVDFCSFIHMTWYVWIFAHSCAIDNYPCEPLLSVLPCMNCCSFLRAEMDIHSRRVCIFAHSCAQWVYYINALSFLRGFLFIHARTCEFYSFLCIRYSSCETCASRPRRPVHVFQEKSYTGNCLCIQIKTYVDGTRPVHALYTEYAYTNTIFLRIQASRPPWTILVLMVLIHFDTKSRQLVHTWTGRFKCLHKNTYTNTTFNRVRTSRPRTSCLDLTVFICFDTKSRYLRMMHIPV